MEQAFVEALNSFDNHGSCYIKADRDWRDINISIIHNSAISRSKEITGISLNSLLRGLFLLFGGGSSAKDFLPGGLEVWEDIVEPSFLYLLHSCKLQEILSRIIGVIFSDQTEEFDKYLAIGSIQFLIFWVGGYSSLLGLAPIIGIQSFVSTALSAINEKEGICLSVVTDLLRQLKIIVDSKVNEMSTSDLSLTNGPYISQTCGQWNGGAQEERKAELKATLKATPIKLEIFGASNLLDSDSDDSEMGSLNEVSNTDNAELQLPIARVPPERQLLTDLTSSPGLVDLLIDFDTLEIARQWTLVDHALFYQIPLHSLISSSIKVIDSIKFGGLKRLVDRFNATSLWVSNAILSGETPDDRANIFLKLINLASCLRKLGNFYSLMAVLTGLQQGSISRLKITMSLIHESFSTLEELKDLMSAGKNYAKYREEIGRLSSQLLPPNIRAIKGINVDWRRSSSTFKSHLHNDNQFMNQSADSIHAVVPHMAAHIAAVTAVAECHGEFLSDSAHLLNITKWRLCAGILLPINCLQKLNYKLRPIRALIGLINHSIKPHLHRSASSSAAAAKSLYQLSEEKESDSFIASHERNSHSEVSSIVSVSKTLEKRKNARVTFGQTSNGASNSSVLKPVNQQNSSFPTSRSGGNKRNVKDSISEESNEDDSNEEEDDDDANSADRSSDDSDDEEDSIQSEVEGDGPEKRNPPSQGPLATFLRSMTLRR